MLGLEAAVFAEDEVVVGRLEVEFGPGAAGEVVLRSLVLGNG